MPSFHIRNFCPGDEPALRAVFHASVHGLACKDYTAEQLAAWAPRIAAMGCCTLFKFGMRRQNTAPGQRRITFLHGAGDDTDVKSLHIIVNCKPRRAMA